MSNAANQQNFQAAELQWLPSVTVDGYGAIGNFDKSSGGDASATISKYRPGGMGNEISYVSLPTFSDLVLTRVYDQGRDQALIADLRSLSGTTYATASLQPLDNEGAPWGSPRTFRGRIASIMDGNTDSTSSTPRSWEFHLSVETYAN